MGTMLFDFEGESHYSIFLYIGRSTLLYLLHFIAISSIFMLVTMILEDSGKVISMTLLAFLLLTVGYKSLDHIPLVSTFYEYSVFNQISFVFTKRLTPGEILVSIISGITTFIIFTFTAKVLFQKKEIK
ncbi:hypothetical protein GCM10007199_39080 [Fictibacillus barbaricus]|nr:hypothetical protein GCM10007199_39080 [Fictibacillus barbaricus]